jgi:hypothetical protein
MMSLNKTGIELVREINNEWVVELEEDPDLRNSILVYEPFTDEYWTEKYKIVWCNLEPGGEIENENEKVLSLNSYKKLLERKNPTIKNTSLFIYCLYNKLIGNDIDEKQKDAIKSDYELLMNCMKKVTYMNLLKDTGTTNFKDSEIYFNKFFSADKDNKNRERTINFIKALNPDIFVITGKGKGLIEQLYVKKFDEKHSFVNNKTLFINLGHPGHNWDKGYIYNNVNMIYENLVKYNLLK